MKKISILVLVLIIIAGCSSHQDSKTEHVDSKKTTLDGFWALSSRDYLIDSSSELCLDFEAVAILKPHALGSHILIEGDSISLFRYPFEYFGTFTYEILGDSLFIKTNLTPSKHFALQKQNDNKLQINFEEEYFSGCSFPGEATYERITPNTEIITKLKRDSISYDSIPGRWWYLSKEISVDDGSEPPPLNFPKGMPDSLFVSQKQIHPSSQGPFLELKLNNKRVKLFIKNPYNDSFQLTPASKKDELLFSNFIDYGSGRIDTIYHEVLYWR